jgi:hypothetical protein
LSRPVAQFVTGCFKCQGGVSFDCSFLTRSFLAASSDLFLRASVSIMVCRDTLSAQAWPRLQPPENSGSLGCFRMYSRPLTTDLLAATRMPAKVRASSRSSEMSSMISAASTKNAEQSEAQCVGTPNYPLSALRVADSPSPHNKGLRISVPQTHQKVQRAVATNQVLSPRGKRRAYGGLWYQVRAYTGACRSPGILRWAMMPE